MCSEFDGGYIYIVTNPVMNGYIKIGYAKDVARRIKEFNTSSIKDYEPYAIYQVASYQSDKCIHGIIELLNPRLKVNGKEFFRMEPEEAYKLLEYIAKITGTEDLLYLCEKGRLPELKTEPVMQEEMEEVKAIKVDEVAKSRKSSFSFEDIGLKSGDIIVSIIDNNIRAVVSDNNKIIMGGEPYSLSGAVRKIMTDKGSANKSGAYQGPAYWSYEGKLLTDWREELTE